MRDLRHFHPTSMIDQLKAKMKTIIFIAYSTTFSNFTPKNFSCPKYRIHQPEPKIYQPQVMGNNHAIITIKKFQKIPIFPLPLPLPLEKGLDIPGEMGSSLRTKNVKKCLKLN